jgi:hypothetical protein
MLGAAVSLKQQHACTQAEVLVVYVRVPLVECQVAMFDRAAACSRIQYSHCSHLWPGACACCSSKCGPCNLAEQTVCVCVCVRACVRACVALQVWFRELLGFYCPSYVPLVALSQGATTNLRGAGTLYEPVTYGHTAVLLAALLLQLQVTVLRCSGVRRKQSGVMSMHSCCCRLARCWLCASCDNLF